MVLEHHFVATVAALWYTVHVQKVSIAYRLVKGKLNGALSS